MAKKDEQIQKLKNEILKKIKELAIRFNLEVEEVIEKLKEDMEGEKEKNFSSINLNKYLSSFKGKQTILEIFEEAKEESRLKREEEEEFFDKVSKYTGGFQDFLEPAMMQRGLGKAKNVKFKNLEQGSRFFRIVDEIKENMAFKGISEEDAIKQVLEGKLGKVETRILTERLNVIKYKNEKDNVEK